MEDRLQSNFKLFQTEDNTNKYGIRSVPLSFLHSSTHSSMYPFIYPFTHSSIHPSMYPFIYLFTHSSIHPSMYPFIYLFTHSSINPFIHLSIHSSIFLPIHIHLFKIHLFTYLSVHQSIYHFNHPSIYPIIQLTIHPSIASSFIYSSYRYLLHLLCIYPTTLSFICQLFINPSSIHLSNKPLHLRL